MSEEGKNKRIKAWIFVVVLFLLGIELLIGFNSSYLGLSSYWRGVIFQLCTYQFLFLLIYSFLNILVWIARLGEKGRRGLRGLAFRLLFVAVIWVYFVLFSISFLIILPWLSSDGILVLAASTIVFPMLAVALYEFFRQRRFKEAWLKKRPCVSKNICYEGISQKHQDSATKYLKIRDWRNTAHYFWLAAETLSKEPDPAFGFGVAWFYLLSAAAYFIDKDIKKARKALELGRLTLVTYKLRGESREHVSAILDFVSTILSGNKQQTEQRWSNSKIK